ncbi:CHAT domain-containing protein [Myxococcus sp. CA056]|uniref:CHAT domain-containing protein n=1 Tax=Myxococcus sp. CA056 TaxID=2741740 RepID=UPI0035301675
MTFRKRRPEGCHWSILALAAGMLLVVCPGAAFAKGADRPPPPTLVECRERFEAHPEEQSSAMCFYQCAQAAPARDTVRRELKALMERHPDNGWLALVSGHVEYLADRKAAEAPYHRAALTFRRLKNAEGEVLAGINLRSILLTMGRGSEAREWTQRVVEVAQSSGRADLHARALLVEASQLYEVDQDLGRAFRVLKRAEPLTFPDGSPGLKAQYLTVMTGVSERLGRLEEATEANRRLAEHAHDTRGLALEGQARFTLANLALRRLDRDREPGGGARVLALAREALVAAENTGSKELVSRALRLVVDVLGPSPEEQLEAEALLERCMELAEELDSNQRRIACLWTRAERRAGQDPAAALRDSDTSLRLAYAHGEPQYLALALRGRGTVAYRTQPLLEALVHVERALDAVEALRQSQTDASSQAELFSNWARDYHRLAGWTLEAGGATGNTAVLPEREALRRAFGVSERLRARTLLDALMASRALFPSKPTPERQEVQRRLTAVQRRLLEPNLPAPEREKTLRELQALEHSERDLRPAPRHGSTEFASLEAVEQELAEDEALLAFLVGDDKNLSDVSGGGAWVLVVTRGGARAHRIPERARLAQAVTLFSGLLERRDGSEVGAAAALHAQLLGPALAALPPGVRKLLLVPDGPLHDLPFAALRERPGDEPLVARYELALVPSASLWRHWRLESPHDPGGEALVLADPDRTKSPLDGAIAAATERGGVFAEAARLGALPEARREGHAVMEALRTTQVTPHLLVGTEASERALKNTDLARVKVLHLAAHAVVDAEAPERSALVLAPGSDEEDGILQPRDIVDLPLKGALVVLSACRSASGAVLAGEGVLSLARAFFEAGSRAVVASLWPLQDAEAADLVERFYRHLAMGASTSAALRAAQLEAIDDGLPPAAWAGLVVLGDASLVVTSPREDPARFPVGVGSKAVLVIATALLIGLALGARHRTRGGPRP